MAGPIALVAAGKRVKVGVDPTILGAQGLFHDAGECAAPPRVCRADHARLRISEQDRDAVGSEDAERQVRCLGHQGIDFWPPVGRPGPLGNRDTI